MCDSPLPSRRCVSHNLPQVSEKRIIIGFRSNDGSYPREPPPEELWPPNAGEFVRATLLKGGYDIQVLDDGSIQISFLIQVTMCLLSLQNRSVRIFGRCTG